MSLFRFLSFAKNRSSFRRRVHALPRRWSNHQLKKICSVFEGAIINVSAWQDSDKNGHTYREYFPLATSYSLSNFKSSFRGFQGYDNEFFLDLEKELPEQCFQVYDVVFNHTTLEHIYDFRKAFSNICLMTKDVVILVTPFIQQYHSDYGDYWRFSPLAIKRLFEEEGLNLVYQTSTNLPLCSVYTISVASRSPMRWSKYFNDWHFSLKNDSNAYSDSENYIGSSLLSLNISLVFEYLLMHVPLRLLLFSVSVIRKIAHQ